MDARTPDLQATPNTLYIGDIARRSGRSVHTIRWYEAQGLMPGVVRDRGRRRVYNDYHIGWLDLMERLRLTGMSIKQLRDYTTLVKQGSATLRKRRALLAEHQLRVRAMITTNGPKRSRWSTPRSSSTTSGSRQARDPRSRHSSAPAPSGPPPGPERPTRHRIAGSAMDDMLRRKPFAMRASHWLGAAMLGAC
ncbi:DNA-binding transcriptional MerR regulator [Bradyrhizobium sp. USDA 4011]